LVEVKNVRVLRRQNEADRARDQRQSQEPIPYRFRHMSLRCRDFGGTITRCFGDSRLAGNLCRCTRLLNSPLLAQPARGRYPLQLLAAESDAVQRLNWLQSTLLPSLRRVPAGGIGYFSPVAQLNRTARSPGLTRPSASAWQ